MKEMLSFCVVWHERAVHTYCFVQLFSYILFMLRTPVPNLDFRTFLPTQSVLYKTFRTKKVSKVLASRATSILPRDKNLFLMGCFQKYIEIWHFVTKQFLILAFYIAYTGVITLKTSGNSISIFLMNEIKKMERPQSFPSS